MEHIKKAKIWCIIAWSIGKMFVVSRENGAFCIYLRRWKKPFARASIKQIAFHQIDTFNLWSTGRASFPNHSWAESIHAIRTGDIFSHKIDQRIWYLCVVVLATDRNCCEILMKALEPYWCYQAYPTPFQLYLAWSFDIEVFLVGALNETT